MADIKKIKVGNTTYDVRDATAARSNHTHDFSTINSRGEAYLAWGGKNFSGSYGPIDAAMVPELGANRLAFMPADAVTIEYSRDGGATWTDYGPTDHQKADLFNGRGASFTIGKATSGAGNVATNKYQLRVNIYTGAGRVYTILNKFVIYLSTSGTNNNWCTIRARKQSDYTAGNDKWTTFADKISVSGWPGYNVINTSGTTTYGNTASTQYGHIQFIFGCDTGSTNNSYPGLQINKIFGFGGVGWTTPSTMAKTGHMYTYDASQNVTFPAGVSAKSFTENGTSLSNKYLGKTAKAADADKLDGNDSTYYLDYNNLNHRPTLGTAASKNTGTSSGNIPILDSNGKLADSVIPAVAITDTYVVTTEAAMLALSAQKGDIAIRSDLNKSFVLQVTPASTLANWKELLTPTDAVLSVNGKKGAVTLNLDDINDGSTRKLTNYLAKSIFDAAGDLLVGSGNDTYTKLAKGSNGTFLGVNSSGNVAWVSNPNSHNSHIVYSGKKSDGTTDISSGTASSGNITLGDSGVTAGTYKRVTVNAKGIVIGGDNVDADTNTWRKIQLNGTDKLGTGTNTTPLNIKAGSNMTITESNGTFTFAATDTNTDTHYTNYLQIKGNGTEAVKFTQNVDKSLNLKPGNNVSISAASGEITISATDTNTHNSHIVYSGKKSDGTTDISSGTASSGNITLGDSGVTAGAYGDTAAQTPGYGSTFKVPSISVNAKGIVTAIGEHTVKIPASDNTDTKVTSVDNHYPPTANAEAELTATLSGTAGAYAKDREYTVLTGVKAQRDAKGHVTGITYTAQKIKDTDTTYSTVSKTSSGLCPQLPDETTATKYLRQDGMWVTPPNNDTKNTAGSSVDDTNTLYLIGANSKTNNGAVTKSNTNVYMKSNNLYAKAFYASSDRRLKENIKDLDLNCLDLVNNINLREFSWKTDEEHKPVIGAIAQELKQVLPEKYMHEFIGGEETENEYLSVNDSKLVYLLIGAIQEQQKEIEELKRKIA